MVAGRENKHIAFKDKTRIKECELNGFLKLNLFSALLE